MLDSDESARSTGLDEDVSRAVPRPVRVAAALSWRLLLIVAAVGVLAWIVGYLSALTVPLGIALLASALFAPLVDRLVRWHVPKALATGFSIIVGGAVVGGVLTLVATTVASSLPQLLTQLTASLDSINSWLQHGPLHLSQAQLRQTLNAATNAIKGDTAELPARALQTAAALGTLLARALLALFILIFFLYDGAVVWRLVLHIVPPASRDRLDVAGRRGFASLVSYVRATVAVALIDAATIGVGLLVVGVPLAVPLAALIFIGAFIPILGALLTGAVAVLVALVAKGFVVALVVLAILIAVMQVEGNVLQPLLLGRAVELHPLAVVLAIAVGVEVAGIIGALLAVPILAVTKSAIGSLLHDPEVDPARVNPLRSARRLGGQPPASAQPCNPTGRD